MIWVNCWFKGFLEQDKVNMSWKQQMIMNEMRKDEKWNIFCNALQHPFTSDQSRVAVDSIDYGFTRTYCTHMIYSREERRTDRSSAGLKRLSLAGRGSLNTPQPHKHRTNREMIMQMKVFLMQINTVISHYHHYCSNLISTAEDSVSRRWNSTLRRNLARKTKKTREKFEKQSLKKIKMPINVFVQATR